MSKHEEKTCLRCEKLFECKVGDVANCQCSAVKLSDDTQIFLEESFFDCLCSGCLQAINDQLAAISHLDFPSSNLVEGVHFYMDGTRFVFTETYFLLRGYCCRSGCRHCPYGFLK